MGYALLGGSGVPFLAGIAEGLTNPQIEEALIISRHTIESHRKNLPAKFGASNTATLIKMAIKNSLI